MIVLTEALDRCVLDCAVHPFDRAIRPREVWLREAMLDTVGLADHVVAYGPGIDGVAVPRLLSELALP